jgi:DNA-binding NtrC family response regulator
VKEESTVRILLVDDELPILTTLAANLELDDFEVTTAPNGQVALEVFRRERFDLVLTDVRMPGMNGVDLFREIRRIRAECPVVLMTAFALEGLVHDAIVEGVFTVLPKPFEVERVAASLNRAARAPIVLVVDGNAALGRALADGLRASNLRVEHAPDADRAISTIRGGTVDVCVVDMHLAGSDAPALMERIRGLDATIVQIALAGHEASVLVRQAAARGSFACLEKPVDPQALVEVIARARGAAAQGTLAPRGIR